MRTPIACCLAWPQRHGAGVAHLDLVQAGRLDFEAPDIQAFPCLRIARESIAAGGSAMAIVNAANEIAVAAFLERRIGFLDIAAVIDATLSVMPASEPASLAEVEAVDEEARARAVAAVARAGRPTTTVGVLES
jgi:1-deoxy-D-xylulose-5-phosphate reductoisomerase